MARPKSKVIDLDVLLSKYYVEEVEIFDETSSMVTVPVTTSIRLEISAGILKKTSDEIDHVDLFVKLFEHDERLKIRVDLLTRFKKEVEVYTKAIPALSDFQKELTGCSEDLYQTLFAKCMGARVSAEGDKTIPDITGAIILENLKVQGYSLEDSRSGFDLESSKLIIANLARFHAVPLAMRLLRLDLFKEKVVPCLADIKQHVKHPKYHQVIDEIIKQGIEGNDELTPYLEAIDEAIECSKLNSWFKSFANETWVTLCHSRYWILNVMLHKNEEGKPVASKIVDLQMLEYLPCCSDLVFFLFTSVNSDVLDANYDDLLDVYYNKFVEVLGGFQVFMGPYTIENFKEEVNEQGQRMIMKVLQMLPYIACEEYGEDNEPVLGPRYKKKMKDTILAMISKGWIE